MVSAEDVKRNPFFKGMGLDEVEAILAEAEIREVEGTLFKEGSKGESFFVILEGEIYVAQQKRREEDYTVLATLKEGDIVGELALFGHTERMATCEVPDKKKARVLEISKSAFRNIKEKFPKAAMNIYEKILSAIAGRFKILSEKKERRSFWL